MAREKGASRVDKAIWTFTRGTKMTTKICDKCGKAINDNPMTNVCARVKVTPRYRITRYLYGMISEVDLCDACQEKLYEWIAGGEDK